MIRSKKIASFVCICNSIWICGSMFFRRCKNVDSFGSSVGFVMYVLSTSKRIIPSSMYLLYNFGHVCFICIVYVWYKSSSRECIKAFANTTLADEPVGIPSVCW